MAEIGLSEKEAYFRAWYGDRQRGRTDLLWLCNEVLGYKDVEASVHGPIIENLQKFHGGTDLVDDKGNWAGYKPKTELWELEGPRNRLLLWPRLHLKTTINSAHKIQAIINYPDIRIMLGMATGNQVSATASAILNHFRFNERFRFLYPEYCPPAKNAKDFGSLEGFTVPCRKNKMLKEPTLATASVEKTETGMHYDWIWLSDVVTELNVGSPTATTQVIDHIKMMDYLIERRPTANGPKPGWFDIEGTIYDYSDAYCWLQEEEEKKPDNKKSWVIMKHTAYRNNKDFGEPLWAARFTEDSLKEMSDKDPYKFSCQMLLNPIPKGSGLASREQILFVERRVMRAQPMHLHMTIDLAGMESGTNDFTVVNTHGFDRDGRMNVLEILAERIDPFDLIDVIFVTCKAFPKIIDIKIEKEAHSRVLLPFLMREQQKRGVFLPPIIPIKRDNKTSKKQRISGLQPWFKSGIIRFASEISAKAETIQEILRFSRTSTYHDDVLDTLADAMQGRDGGYQYDIVPSAKQTISLDPQASRFLGFDPITKEDIWFGEEVMATAYCDPRTGL